MLITRRAYRVKKLTTYFFLQTSTELDKVVQTISFTNIRWGDSGRYTCKANNGALDSDKKEIMVTQTINLNVNCKCVMHTLYMH